MSRGPQPAPHSRLVNRNITALCGRTSLRLEPEIWDVLDAAARRLGLTTSGLVREIERASPHQPRTSAVRVWLVAHLRERAEAAEHASADALRRVAFDSIAAHAQTKETFDDA